MAGRNSRRTAAQIYRKTTLRNGLRIVTEKIPTVRSVSLGVWVDVGTRHETRAENGISHFVEHMLFKGTHRRTARQISGELEAVGGSINAFTSREQTCFNARVLDEHLDLAVDVLSDITCCSTFTPENIRREKQVILEEIKEAFETPSDRIHDEFAEVYWNGHPLGQPILGSAGFARSRILEYVRRHYRAGSVVIAGAGNLSHDRLVRLVSEKFCFPKGRGEAPLPAARPDVELLRLIEGGNAQTHLSLGYPGVPYDSPKKNAALALNAYLGGGMSSVIFQKVRELKGLAYSVYTFADFYRDTGMFGAYVGTDRAHVAGALEIIIAEMERMKRRKLPSLKFDPLKAQLKGQIMLGMESTSARMNRLARQELYLGRFIPFAETLASMERLTPFDLLEFANESFDRSQLTVVTLGPAPHRRLREVTGAGAKR